MDDANAQEVSDVETEEEIAFWKEKRNCTFCAAFLDSPCSKQFKLWSVCVDKAKEGMFKCIPSHFRHFKVNSKRIQTKKILLRNALM